MSGNDFEKQVQQKMDELSFVPSDAVWPEVEKQIAGRKKRRALFLWLPFLLLLLGGAAWMYISSIEAGVNKNQIAGKEDAAAINNNKTGAGNTTSLVNKNKEVKPPVLLKDSIHKQHTAEDEVAVNNNGDKKKNILTAAPEEDNNKGDNNIDTDKDDDKSVVINRNRNKPGKNNNTVIVKEIKPAGKHLHETSAFETTTREKTRHLLTEQTGVEEEAVAVTANESPEKETKNGVEAIAMEKAGVIAEAPVAGSVIENSSAAFAEPVASDSAKHTDKNDSTGSIAKSKKDEKKAKKKIEWGINLRGGFTNISNGFSGVFSSSQTYDASAYLSNLNSTPSAPNNNPNGANNGSFAKPSGIKTGLSYAAGVFIHKPLGNNVSISAGLNYSYYSNRIDIGAKIDSNKALVQYRTGSTATYTNRFHFIELPVTIEKQLGNKSRFSINGGLAFSLLAGSNALLYDAQKNIYTEGKSQINKMQASLLAGARYRLFEKRFPVEIGPGFNYALGNLFAKELYGSRHLFFAGINARIFLSNKKQ